MWSKQMGAQQLKRQVCALPCANQVMDGGAFLALHGGVGALAVGLAWDDAQLCPQHRQRAAEEDGEVCCGAVCGDDQRGGLDGCGHAGHRGSKGARCGVAHFPPAHCQHIFAMLLQEAAQPDPVRPVPMRRASLLEAWRNDDGGALRHRERLGKMELHFTGEFVVWLDDVRPGPALPALAGALFHGCHTDELGDVHKVCGHGIQHAMSTGAADGEALGADGADAPDEAVDDIPEGVAGGQHDDMMLHVIRVQRDPRERFRG